MRDGETCPLHPEKQAPQLRRLAVYTEDDLGTGVPVRYSVAVACGFRIGHCRGPEMLRPTVRTTDVFTPGKPAQLTFVEREAINTQLVDALRTPGKQVVVYGPSGCGKTTLLFNKLHQLYPEHITVRCTAATTFESLLLVAFDLLDPYYTAGASVKRGSALTTSLGADYLKLKSSIEASVSRETTVSLARIVPPQLTPQRLAEFCGAAGCCLVLEDFHKVPVAEKTKVAQTMKVFMDTAAEYAAVRIVAIGAVDSAREVIQYDPDMRNRVAEIAVPLMSREELGAVISKGEALLNMSFGRLGESIAEYSSGLAAVCHQLALSICQAAGVEQTCEQLEVVSRLQLQGALQRYLQDASDTLKAVFDSALRRTRTRRFDNTRLILMAMAGLGSDGGTHAEILREIRRREPDYPPGNTTTYLRQLETSQRGGILRRDSAAGRYHFSDPLYLVYAQCLFDPKRKAAGPGWLDLRTDLDKMLIQITQGLRLPSIVLEPLRAEDVDLAFAAWLNTGDAEGRRDS